MSFRVPTSCNQLLDCKAHLARPHGCLFKELSVFFLPILYQELDRAAAETVRKLFDRINGALYEGKSTGTAQGDRECQEWSTTFPHLKSVVCE